MRRMCVWKKKKEETLANKGTAPFFLVRVTLYTEMYRVRQLGERILWLEEVRRAFRADL